MIKIMAPAGSPESLNAAIKAGADEVYMGISGFGARRFATNFSVEEYCQAIDLAHRNDVRVHLTLNTIMSDAELNQIKSQIHELWQTGLDAVIVQDMGVAFWLKEHFPDLPLHASTQMSLANGNELQWIEKQGFKRAVLARELSFDEMEKIRSKTSIELEVFASGALCLCCSGKCYLSSFIGGRSGNRGMCTQPCRQKYSRLVQDVDFNENSRIKNDNPNNDSKLNGSKFDNDKNDKNHFEINKNEMINPESNDKNRFFANKEGYFLSTKDQWQQFSEIEKLIKIGINSIKIEGRMKSPIYVYEAVHYYRSLIDQILGVDLEEQKKRLFIKDEPLDENEDRSFSDNNQSSKQNFFDEKNKISDFKRSQNKKRQTSADNVLKKSDYQDYPTDNIYSNLHLNDINNQSAIHSKSQSKGRPENRSVDYSSNNAEIVKIFNRGYAKGYFYEHDPNFINTKFSADNGYEIGTIKNGVIHLNLPIRNGDGIVYLDSFGQKIEGQNVSKINLITCNANSKKSQDNNFANRYEFRNKKTDYSRERQNFSKENFYSNIRNQETTQVDAAFAGQAIILESPPPQNACFLNKTFDFLVNKRIEQKIKQTTRHLPISVCLNAHCGKPLELSLTHSRAKTDVKSNENLEKSQKVKTNPQQLQNDLDRFGNSSFYMKNCEISADLDVFIPRSLLNQLRQKATIELENQIIQSYRRPFLPKDNSKNSTNEFQNSPINNQPQKEKTFVHLKDNQIIPSEERSALSINPPKKQLSEGLNIEPINLSNGSKTENLIDCSENRLSRFSAAVRTVEQFEICQKMGIPKIYYLMQPVVFEDNSREQLAFLLAQTNQNQSSELSAFPTPYVSGTHWNPDSAFSSTVPFSSDQKLLQFSNCLASSLFDAIVFNEQKIDFATDWTFNIGNVNAILFYLERFPRLQTIFLSPELSEKACSDIIHKMDSRFKNRPVRLGLNIYGHLTAMFTRKTLFPQNITDLVNQDGRNIAVIKNRDWFENATEKMTGSSVYYSEPLDLIDAIPWIENLHFDEWRFDFTIETRSEIISILKRAIHSVKGESYSTHSYGFTKGIF